MKERSDLCDVIFHWVKESSDLCDVIYECSFIRTTFRSEKKSEKIQFWDRTCFLKLLAMKAIIRLGPSAESRALNDKSAEFFPRLGVSWERDADVRWGARLS